MQAFRFFEEIPTHEDPTHDEEEQATPDEATMPSYQQQPSALAKVSTKYSYEPRTSMRINLSNWKSFNCHDVSGCQKGSKGVDQKN